MSKLSITQFLKSNILGVIALVLIAVVAIWMFQFSVSMQASMDSLAEEIFRARL